MSEKKLKHAGGRPTKYTPELAARICEIISSSPNGIYKTCATHDELPVPSTIYLWMTKYPEFSERYGQSLYNQSHVLFNSSLDELEDLHNYFYKNEHNGSIEINAGIVSAKKAISDRKARHAAILNKKYRLEKEQENNNSTDTLSKIRDMVADLNKTNTSEI